MLQVSYRYSRFFFFYITEASDNITTKTEKHTQRMRDMSEQKSS